MGSAVCAASWWWPKLRSLVFYALARRCSCAAECNWLRVIMGFRPLVWTTFHWHFRARATTTEQKDAPSFPKRYGDGVKFLE